MLTLRRRHQADCSATPKGKQGAFGTPNAKEIEKCTCRLWIVGTDDNGKFHRDPLNISDSKLGGEKLRDAQAGKPVEPAKVATDLTIEEAYERYLTEMRVRGVKRSSINRFYQGIGNALVAFMVAAGIKTLSAVTRDVVNALVATWMSVSDGVRAQRIRVIKDFFAQAILNEWGVTKNPAAHLRTPRTKGKGKTKPYNGDDEKLIAAFPNWNSRNTDFMLVQTGYALLLVLRYTGLRISDAITFEPRNLQLMNVDGQEIYAYFVEDTLKTGASVYIPIMKEIGDVIVNAPRLTKEFAFYNPEETVAGTEEREDHILNWQGKILHHVFEGLEKPSGVSGVRAHRFRDTFAVDCLSNGVDIRTVSRFLGHEKVSTTLDYYEHYIKSDQIKACRAILAMFRERTANQEAATAQKG